MPGSRVYGVTVVCAMIALLGTGMGLPRFLYGDSTTVAPEFDLYLTHNNIFRSRLIVGANWLDTTSRWSTGNFEYTVDFGLKSFFRRYVYKDPNFEKSKWATVRLGYGYLPDLNHDDGGSNEQRGIAELTLRLPIGGQWLWSDRNKGDFRWVGEVSSQRYRNRLRVERAMAFLGFRGTPYASGEAYYDTTVNRWNRLETKLGIEIPWKYSTVLEPYIAHQAIWESSPAEIVGFVIQKYMAMPLGGNQ